MDQQQQQQQQPAQDQQPQQQPPELQYDYMDLRQDVYYQQDVRMKRHPELQPYVPSDRYTPASTGLTSKSLGGRTLNNKYGSRYATPSLTTSNNNSSSGQPKKYCSMTRLNQLAQPKKRPISTHITTGNNSNGSNTINTATLSTNSSSRSINSISRSLDKQQAAVGVQQRQSPKKQSERSVPQSAPRPQRSVKQQKQQQHQPTPQAARANHQRPQQQQTQRQQPQQERLKKEEQQQQQQQQQQPITPISSVKRTVIMTPSTPTTVVPTTTPQSSTPVVVNSGERSNKQTTTPAVQPPTPASSLEEDLESAAAANNNASSNLNATRDIVHETSSLADQVAELSVNECLYRSAASDLVPDSENSTNGINDYDRNPDSLCREFEQDLIAKGIVGAADDTFDEFTSPRANYSNNESIRRNSAATIVTSEHSQSGRALQDEDDESDRRIQAEKELREKARLEEEERRKRDELVRKLSSRFSQGSVP